VTQGTRGAGDGAFSGAGASGSPLESSFDSRGGFDDVRQAMTGEIEREADSLLLSRHSFERLLNALLVRAPQRRVALGLIGVELEDWKSHVERLGETDARAALAKLARDLRKRVRGTDELGRLGASQVGVLLVGCEAHVLGGVGERLHHALDGRELGEAPGVLRASVGVSIVCAHPRAGGPNAAALLHELSGALERRC
jgi:diguanylate cyclase (GGDEF)-like protein